MGCLCRIGLHLALCWWALTAQAPAQAQPVDAQRETAVKAAFLYKFSGFAQWPASAFPAPESPFVIGVFGNDEIADELEALVSGRTLGTRPVVARRVREIGPGMGLQMLFIGKQDDASLRELISRVLEPVLVVTDQESALALGSVINLSTDSGRVRFSVSLLSAEARSIKLSARLLTVAQRVEGAAR